MFGMEKRAGCFRIRAPTLNIIVRRVRSGQVSTDEGQLEATSSSVSTAPLIFSAFQISRTDTEG
jgi:hypothetical protein